MQNNKSKKKSKKTVKANKPRKEKRDLVVRIPAAVSKVSQGRAARISSRGDGVSITHREYIDDLTCQAVFNVGYTLALNPGITSTFPWLGLMANNYEFYRFKQLSFEYHPMVGSSVSGSIMMAVELDVSDATPDNKQKFMTFRNVVQGPVWAPLKLNVPAADLHRFAERLFTRPQAVPSNNDSKTYDIGNLHIATDGGTTIKTGSLYATYVVELSSAHVPNSYPWDFSGNLKTNGNSTKAAPLAIAIAQNGNPANPVIRTKSNTEFYLGTGEYLVNLGITGTGMLASAMTTILAISSGAGVISDYTTITNNAQTVTNVLGKIAISAPAVISFTTALWTTVTDVSMRLGAFENTLT